MRIVRLLSLVTVLLSGATGCALAPVEGEEGGAGRVLQRQVTCTILGDVQVGKPRAYFSPFDPVEDQVLCALDGARREVVVAQYNIRSERVIAKLIELRRRGVDVRVSVDASNAANAWNDGDDRLEREGVKLVRFEPAATNAIMHLKASVIDDAFAMSGSFNWNETAAAGNDENMIAFRDPEIVSRFKHQILELLGERPRSVELPRANAWAQLHFAPETAVDRVIASAIDAAKTSVDVAMFTFTMRSISDALVRAHKRGVRVRMVVEQKQQDLSDAEDRVAAAGALVVRGQNRTGPHSAMHQKYAVLDETRVITGATNWTFSGTRNNEEDLLVLDLPELAAAYSANFRDLLHVYGGLDDGGQPRAASPVLFHGVQSATGWGDTLVAVGSDPALGAWHPWAGVPMGAEMFPAWTGRAQLPAGARVEWKLVTLRANGTVDWEPGANRALIVPASGRAVVIGGTFGDTSTTWTPAR
ncbi:MAG: carbohydrate-binding protein [Deltaproteobacteria bacterium]|nr:carbohydrate-binding protein [Deltaproteobacteria bacterium]